MIFRIEKTVFINSFIQALPHLTTFGAIALLYGAFAEPEITPVLDAQKIKIVVFLVIVTAVMLIVAYISTNSASSGSNYSGKTYNDFSDYIKDQDPDLYDSIVDRYNSLIP